MNIIFFGTSSFSVMVLQKLMEGGLVPRAVVTAPDRPAGRGQRMTAPPVKEIAIQHRIPFFQPQRLKDDAFLETLRNFSADVFVIASYGKMLPLKLLAIPPKGALNVHPSLLPKYRGPAPLQACILNGDKTIGVTIMLTDEQMDHGPILASTKYQAPSTKQTYQELHDILAQIGGTLLVETLPRWIAGEITPQEQKHQNATYTKLLTKEDGHINWSKSAEEIDRMVRALNPWPGTWSYCGSPTSAIFAEVGLPHIRRIKILKGYPYYEETFAAQPGTIVKTKSGHVAAATGEGLYMIEKVQREGKRIFDSKTINDGFDLFSQILR